MKSPLLQYFIKYSIFTGALFLIFFGYYAAAVYFLTFMLAYPILVSMWLHRLKENNKIFLETTKDRWIFNINGIPVQEEINSLYNIHTTNEKTLESIFKLLAYCKIIIMITIAYFAIKRFSIMIQMYFADHDSWLQLIVLSISFLFTLFILYRLWQGLQLIIFITRRRWHIINEYHDNQYYYSAYQLGDKAASSVYIPLLAIIFAF